MVATPFVHHQFVHAAPVHRVNENVLANAFVPEASACRLSDPALAVLARTAANWFTPLLANRLQVSALHGRIRLDGHVCNGRPLGFLKATLLRVPGVVGLDMMVTVDPVMNPLQAYPVGPQRLRAG